MTKKPPILVFGEVLFDCFPDGSRVLGGAPFNVAWNLRGLGAAPLLVSRVGDDDWGHEIRTAMDAWGMETAGLQMDLRRATGRVEIELEEGEPSYSILADRAYDFIEPLAITGRTFAMIVHGTLALRSRVSRESLEELMRDHPVPSFYDVNLRDPWWDPMVVSRFLASADTVKLNEDEMVTLAPEDRDPAARAQRILERGPQTICLTRGAEGAEVYTKDGLVSTVTPPGDTEVVDTVGAGDAFASVFILGRVQGWSLKTTLQRAQEFAAAVVGVRGATVNDESFYQRFREGWSS